jgi:hypothetical protein
MFKALIKSKYHEIIRINYTIYGIYIYHAIFFAEVKNQHYNTDTDMESWVLNANGQYPSKHIP